MLVAQQNHGGFLNLLRINGLENTNVSGIGHWLSIPS